MTYAEREEIFAKEVLDVKDIQKMFECDKGAAYKLIRRIRAGSADRLGIEGKCHIQDYIDYFKLPTIERYGRKIEEREINRLW